MYKTVLVALDLGDHEDVVMKKAIKFANESNAKLILAHVQQIVVPNVGAGIMSDSSVIEMDDDSRKLIESYKNRAVKNGVKDVKVVIEDGVNIVSSIIDNICVENDVDLIVTGSSNTSGISKFLLGSISSGIAKHAKCDVFVVKDHG